MNKRIPHYLIESFLAVSEETTFQKAADILGITQSTLSKQMILLEGLLPHKIFAFDGRKKILTDYGKSLFNSLKPKFDQTQELIEQTSIQFSNPENLQIRICGRGELLDMIALNLKFQSKIVFMPMSNDAALEAVLGRKAEIAIVHSGIDSHEIIMKPFIVNNFRITIPKKLMKQAPKNESEMIEKLKQLPSLLYKKEDPVLSTLFKSWGINFQDLNLLRTYPNYMTLAQMVNKGIGWAILPSNIEIDDSLNHVIRIQGKSLMNRKFSLVYRRDLSTAVWMKEFLAEIKTISETFST